MKICIIGDFSDNLDEGFKNIAFHISEELRKYNNIITLNSKDIFSVKFIKEVRGLSTPDVIHYATAPSLASFFILKFLKRYWNGKPKTMMSALFPRISPFGAAFIPFLKPDLILVQSIKSRGIFHKFGCKTRILPNGVDISRFNPVSKEMKTILRMKYGIDKEKYVVLHVGHIKNDRGLQVFCDLVEDDILAIIVASRYIEVNPRLYARLERAGCKIFSDYIREIEELYALADCYIFPAQINHSILMPLSVLEAMASNLPVVSLRIEGLQYFFDPDGDLIFVDDLKSIVKYIKLKIKSRNPGNRTKVLGFSWENIGIQLNRICAELVR